MDFLNTEMFDRVNRLNREELIIDADVVEVNDHKIDSLWLAPMFVSGFLIGVVITILTYIMIL